MFVTFVVTGGGVFRSALLSELVGHKLSAFTGPAGHSSGRRLITAVDSPDPSRADTAAASRLQLFTNTILFTGRRQGAGRSLGRVSQRDL